jgi:DNA modification methylase
MRITLWKLSNLKPYENNPRINDDAVAAVMASIREFGFQQPIVVDVDGVIIVGHTRYKAALQLGLDKVPVHIAANLSPEQVQAYRIADNQTATIAEWDYELLPLELSQLRDASFDLSLLGFDADELSDLMDSGDQDGLCDPDDVPAPPEEAVTRPGDLWILGDHRLLCGDCTNSEHVTRLLRDTTADMVLTDPPYGVAYVGKTEDALTVTNDELDEGDLAVLVHQAFDNAQSVSRPGAYWFATVPAGPLHLVFADDWKRRGILRQIMVWAKDSMVLGHSEYHYQHEPILFGWLAGPRHRNKDRTRTTLWSHPRPKASREHPTMKPVSLWTTAIRDGSRSGEVVYDPFLGSGTTIIACEQLNRRGYGLELSPNYCDVIVTRWEHFTGKKAKRITEQEAIA